MALLSGVSVTYGVKMLENARNNQFLSLIWYAVLSSTMKSAIPYHVQDMIHPFVQYIHTVYAVCLLVT